MAHLAVGLLVALEADRSLSQARAFVLMLHHPVLGMRHVYSAMALLAVIRRMAYAASFSAFLRDLAVSLLPIGVVRQWLDARMA